MVASWTLACSIGACRFDSWWQNLPPQTGATWTVGSEWSPWRPRLLLGQWRYLSPPALFPASLSHNDSLFLHVPVGAATAGSLRGLHACCMACCGDDVGVSGDVSWSAALPNQKQDKWKSSKQSCCQENSFRHQSTTSVDYPAVAPRALLFWHF